MADDGGRGDHPKPRRGRRRRHGRRRVGDGPPRGRTVGQPGVTDLGGPTGGPPRRLTLDFSSGRAGVDDMTVQADGGPPRGPRRLARAAPYVLGAAVAFGAVVVFNLVFPAPRPLTQEDVDARVHQALASVTPAPAFSELVYQAVRPSVVLVQIERPRPDGQSGSEEGVGSGVVGNAAGDMLTSLHVVADATSVVVTFADGSRSPADVIDPDPQNEHA